MKYLLVLTAFALTACNTFKMRITKCPLQAFSKYYDGMFKAVYSMFEGALTAFYNALTCLENSLNMFLEAFYQPSKHALHILLTYPLKAFERLLKAF